LSDVATGKKRALTTPGLFGAEVDLSPPKRAPAKRPAAPRKAHPGPFAAVALNRPVRRDFTYAIPAPLVDAIVPGARVAVPFGCTREVGVVVGVSDTTDVPAARLREVAECLDPEPVVGAELLALTRWMSERYACSWGEALAAVLPAPLKRESRPRRVLAVTATEGVGEAELEELAERFPKQHRALRTLLDIDGEIELRELCGRLNLSDSPVRSLQRRGWVDIHSVEAQPDELLGAAVETAARPERLSDEQRAAVDAILRRLDAGRAGSFLLQGVTGSGKTEVYLRAIERALELGRGAIVLVPEISLTPQTVGRFRARFGDVAVLHSRMTDAQRLHMWRRVQRGTARVVVGARSALFAPVADLGVVVVDEEHEPSFKQESVPRYHARDVALERARAAGAVCILGSATPALESRAAARAGTIERLVLAERVGGGKLPPVDVVDLRLEPPGRDGPPIFSRKLRMLMKETLDAGEQAILFLNRRGFVPVLWCAGCKETVRCKSCDLSLTLHRRIRRLVCHGCCDELPVPRACPTCTRPGLKPLGLGSERVEAAARQVFPKARTLRMDSDTMRRRSDYEDALAAFGRGEVDVLVGTQMIAKGLDFPNVTLVGIVSADSSLVLPDFRAAERTFQLVAQVAGRAGRGTRPGRIVVQTSAPEHSAIRCAARHDYDAFAAEEEELRAELGYPPHGRLLRVVFDDTDEQRVVAEAETCAALLAEAFGDGPAMVLGPAPAPVALLRGRHRHHLLVKAPPDGAGEEAFATAREMLALRAETTNRPRMAVDVDPASLL
jgi:primosomal protein N' (replication factor Y)